MGKDEIYETVQNELKSGRIKIKGKFNLRRLPWLLIKHTDISLTTGLYTLISF